MASLYTNEYEYWLNELRRLKIFCKEFVERCFGVILWKRNRSNLVVPDTDGPSGVPNEIRTRVAAVKERYIVILCTILDVVVQLYIDVYIDKNKICIYTDPIQSQSIYYARITHGLLERAWQDQQETQN